MKKFFYIALCFLFIFFSIFLVNSTATENVSGNLSSGYAVVSTNNCYFYKFLMDSLDVNSKYFLIEKSYFVKVLSKTNEEFYKAEYNGIVGYVNKSDIEFVKEVPLCPYLNNITFDITSSSSVELRTEPTTKNGIGTVITTLPANTKQLNYIGKITGEESIKGLGNIWYYASFLIDDKQVFGYVYSPLTKNLSPIVENNENLTIVSVSTYVPLTSLLYLDLSTKNLIILIISVPALVVIYLFTKPTKILKQ